MSIEKNTPNTLRHGKKSFTTLINETINSIRDPAALGFYTLLASKPEGWQIVDKYLMNHFDKGRDFCRKAMKYLKDLGLLETIAIRGDDGRITSWETTLHVHITEKPYSGENCNNNEQSRLLKNQNVVKPESGKTAPINKRVKEIKEKEEIKETCALSRTTLSSFDAFWKKYPSKVDKKKCIDIWKRKKLDNKFEEIMIGLENQNSNEPKWKAGFIPNPSTYLNGERWNDEITAPQVNMKKVEEQERKIENEKRIEQQERLSREESDRRLGLHKQYNHDGEVARAITAAAKRGDTTPPPLLRSFIKGV